MDTHKQLTLAFFYCQNVPGSSEKDRQGLELEYGERIRLFPIPCGGRLEPVHLLKALEEFADAVYVITCPEGACRYFEGNSRAKRRVERAKTYIASIGLETERVGIIMGSQKAPEPLGEVVRGLLDRTRPLAPSPVFAHAAVNR